MTSSGEPARSNTSAPAPAGEPPDDLREEGAGDGYLNSTFKHGLIYGLGNLLAKAIGFVMLPIYTRVLTPEDYGTLELLSMSIDILAMVTGAGLTWAITRYYYYYQDTELQDSVVSTAGILLVSSFALACVVALPFAGGLSDLILGEPRHAGLVRLALAAFFLSAFVELPLAYLRAKQASTHVVVVMLCRLVLALGLNILFLVVLGMGVAGVFYSTILASGAAGGYLTVTTLSEAGLRFSPPVAHKLIRYGFPLVGANVGSFAMHYSDRYFLRVFEDLHAVGLYSLAYKFAMLLAVLIANPFARIWSPKVLEIERAEGGEARGIIRRILSYYNAVLVTAALGIALLAGDAIRVIAAPEFHSAGATVPLLCLGLLFFGYLQIAYIGPSITERSDVIALGALVGAVTVIGANLLFIPRWGAYGAALATVVAFAAQFGVTLWRAERLYPLRLPLGRLFLPVVLAGAVYGAVSLALPAGVPLWTSVPVKLCAVGVFAAFLGATMTGPGRKRAGAIGSLLRPVPTPDRVAGG